MQQDTRPGTTDHIFLQGKSEMARLIREKDWSKHPLGKIEHWPAALRTTLSIVLSSRFPKFLFWGKELFCFYNDAYRPSLGIDGKHPDILGATAHEAWPEIWDTIHPLIQQVQQKGEATWSEDQLIPIYRNGQMEDVYWTFSYSPVCDEEGGSCGVLVTCVETTEKVHTMRRLEESERRLMLSIMQAPVAISVFDGPDHVVEIVNQRALELLGRTKEEVISRPIVEVAPELKDQGLVQLMDSVYQNGDPFSASERPVDIMRNGKLETLYINFVYEPMLDAKGAVRGIMAVGADVTDSVLGRAASEKLVEELQEQEKQKDFFIGMASHELKTPVTTLKGYVQILLATYEGSEDEMLKSSLAAMDRQVMMMTHLIGDMLDLSKMRTGTLELDKQKFIVNSVIRSVIAEIELVNPKHRVVHEEQRDVTVLADKGRISQVLINLLTNAVKYAPNSKKIEVSSSINDNMLRIAVKDEGIGISKSDQEKLFQRFFRVEGKNEHTFPGFGIGLYISADIVRRHGGEIGVSSEPGKGSTFYFTLPILEK